MSTAFEFFYKHAGYSYDPLTQTPEQGRKRHAEKLAQAESKAKKIGIQFEWVSDYDVVSREPNSLYWGLIVVNPATKKETSLWEIQDPDDNYRRVLEAELSLEILDNE